MDKVAMYKEDIYKEAGAKLNSSVAFAAGMAGATYVNHRRLKRKAARLARRNKLISAIGFPAGMAAATYIGYRAKKKKKQHQE